MISAQLKLNKRKVSPYKRNFHVLWKNAVLFHIQMYKYEDQNGALLLLQSTINVLFRTGLQISSLGVK